MSTAPLVSVYLPTRGRPRLLARAITSVLAQSHSEFELLVVVDGRDTATEAVLAKLQSDARVIVTVLAEPGGACRARNIAIDMARGELITGLDDDDEFLPDHLENLVATFRDAGASFACTTTVHQLRRRSFVRHPFNGPITLEKLLMQNVVGNQVLTKTEHLRALGGFDESMPAWQDYDLWVRLCDEFGPGVRRDSRSYIQHLEHDGPRISSPTRIVQGYERFVKKHAALLRAKHLASLELLMFATAHRPFPLKYLPKYIAAGPAGRACSAMLSDRFPRLRDRVRRSL